MIKFRLDTVTAVTANNSSKYLFYLLSPRKGPPRDRDHFLIPAQKAMIFRYKHAHRIAFNEENEQKFHSSK